MPIITDKGPAPSEMLRKIRCSSKSTNRLGTICTYFKNRLPCSMWWTTTNPKDDVRMAVLLPMNGHNESGRFVMVMKMNFTQITLI